MKWSRAVLASVVVVMPVVACGGSSDDGLNGPGVGVPIDDIPKKLGAVTCDLFKGCFGGLYEAFTLGEDCETTYETASRDELPKLKAAIDAGTVLYDGTKVDGCIAAIKAGGCQDNPDTPECDAVFQGTVETGGDCELGAECKSTNDYCLVGSSCPGKCAPREQAGGACKRSDDCAAGLTCSDDTNKCVKPAAIGAACGGGSEPDCGFGGFCIGSDDDAGKPGKCLASDEATSGKKGDDCYAEDKPLCGPDLRCALDYDTTAMAIVGKCAEPAESGGACALSIPSSCPAGEYCAVAPMTVTGTCTKSPVAGEDCITASGIEDHCGPDLRCDGGKCRARQNLGEACESDDVCYSGNCLDGGCAPGGGCG